MATAAIPAAAPEPNDPPNTTPGSPSSGLFTSMLAAVDPARPATFDIPAQATAEGATDAAVEGASSAAYHGSGEASDDHQKTSSTADKKSVLRALLLAAATRWAKGGGYHNKRLDLEKAKAARRAKEDRKVSINRTDGLPGKASSGSGSGGNSGGGKGNSGGSLKGPIKGPSKSPGNSNGNAHKGPAGHSGGSAGPGRSGGGAGRGHGGHGSSGGNGSNGSGSPSKGPKPHGNGSGRDSKPEKVDLSKGRGRSGSDASKAGAQGPSGGTGKNGGASNGGPSGSTKGSGTGTSGGGSKSPDRNNGTGKGHSDTKASKKTSGQDTTGGTGKSPSKDAPGKEHRGAKDGKQPGPSGKDSAAKPGKSGTADAATDKKAGAGSPDTKTDKDTKGKSGQGNKDPQPQTKAEPGKKADGKPFSVKDSRVTGYRDGTRAAKVVAHAKAYRDGAKDGWADTTEVAAKEKTQLDKAHEERKKAQEAARDKEQDVSGAGSSADHHKPQPIDVKGIDANNIWLGEGADRASLSRSEVRSLKTFERRLRAKETSMKKIAEHTKTLKSHAEAQANKVTALMESAKSVKGGTKLIASLTKTADLAKVQAGQAAQIHKRAVRAADRCTAVLANAETRYGGMYKAVVDSDETAPAEMAFYQEGATSHG